MCFCLLICNYDVGAGSDNVGIGGDDVVGGIAGAFLT